MSDLTREDVERIAAGLFECAMSWEPDVCIVGNVTAEQIRDAIPALLDAYEQRLRFDDAYPHWIAQANEHMGQIAALRAEADDLRDRLVNAGIRFSEETGQHVAQIRELRAEVERLKAAAPTEWAYEQACKAIEKHRARADRLEQALRDLAEWAEEEYPNRESVIAARAALDAKP